MFKMLFGLMLLLNNPIAISDWILDPHGSHIGFASVKNDLIAENHTFTQMAGTVSAEGIAQIDVTLASVETLIPLRNERMEQILFSIAKYPIAVVKSQVPLDQISKIGDGDNMSLNIDIVIALHGKELKKSVPVKVTSLGDGSYDVTSLGPIIIHASQFALSDNVEALRKIAGLQSIDLMIPVTFDLRLVQAD